MAPDEQSIVDVLLHQPSSAVTKRFTALIRDFQLEAVEVSDSLQQETEAGSSAAGKKVNVRRFERVKVDEVKPCWKLFSTCHTMW
jgi:hypothetical protein